MAWWLDGVIKDKIKLLIDSSLLFLLYLYVLRGSLRTGTFPKLSHSSWDPSMLMECYFERCCILEQTDSDYTRS